MIQETPPSLAETLTLHSSVCQQVRDEAGREFEPEPCSCSLLVKNGASCLLLCWWSGVHASQHPTVLPRSSQESGSKPLPGVSDGGWGRAHSTEPKPPWGWSVEASAVLARGRDNLLEALHLFPRVLRIAE